MLTHRLKLNDDKTEFVVFAPPRITKVNIDGVRIGDCDIEPNPCARNIGVSFDSSMNMNQQITKFSYVKSVTIDYLHSPNKALFDSDSYAPTGSSTGTRGQSNSLRPWL